MSKPKHAQVTIGVAVGGIMGARGDFEANQATVQATGAACRFTLDRDNLPVAGTLGLLISENEAIQLESPEEISRFRAIRDSAVDCVLEINFDPRQTQPSNFGDIK